MMRPLRFRSHAGRTPKAHRLRFAPLVAMLCVTPNVFAQEQLVDRGTADFGPNSVSQRVVNPGIAQFSAEGALVDRFANDPITRGANLYHQQTVDRRYLFRAPGVSAIYNQSDYLTRDGQGVVGINRSNAGPGRVAAIPGADIVYVLSIELLGPRPTQQEPARIPGMLDRRILPTVPNASRYTDATPGQLNTLIDAQLDPSNPRIIDLQAIRDQRRGARRDPILVERARRWREEREREEQAAREAEAEAQEEESQPENESTQAPDTPDAPVIDE